MVLESSKEENVGDLAQTVEKILDKGLVLNADISVSVSGTELLGIKVRAALASFETAAEYGLEFPSGANFESEGWQRMEEDGRMTECPNCGKETPREELLSEGCPFCGWESAQEEKRAKAEAREGERQSPIT